MKGLRLVLALSLASLLSSSCVTEDDRGAASTGTVKPQVSTTGEKPVGPVADDPTVLGDLQALERQQADMKAAYKKDPKDDKAKAAYVKSTNALAQEFMAAVDTLGP